MGLNEDYLDNLLESMGDEDESDDASLEDEREIQEEEIEEDNDTEIKEETTKSELDEGEDDMEFLELEKLFEDDLGAGPSERPKRMVAVEEEAEPEELLDEVELPGIEEPAEPDLDSLMSEDPFEELDLTADEKDKFPDELEKESVSSNVSSGISSGGHKGNT